MLFQKVQQIYIHLLNIISFPDFIIDKLTSTHLLSQSVHFLQLPVCDQKTLPFFR